MFVLDTDHVTEYQKGTSADAQRLKQRLDHSAEPYATTIITVEEIMRGWMAAVRRTTDPHRQVTGYAKLRQLFRFFATWDVLDWASEAADELQSLRKAKIKISTMDLKIACICLANNAMRLTRNAADFERIPGLQMDDWLSA